MKWLIGFITVTGFNFSVWAVIGLMRFISEKFNSSKSAQADFFSLNKEQVAAVVPAHNEELTIRQTIKSLKRILPRENIYVGSDGSSDRTCRVATNTGVKVINIQPNRGKAGAIRYTINHFGLLNCYQAILIVDADSQIDVNYLKYALPLFNDPKTVAIAGHVLSKWS
ncbi:MAG TPA: glycosyl transferase, partial [Candidatus Jacksonbacteria bacterium]|nr:glycosyl transferase [Candidatus Jacksonbacteria bacterium]